MQGLNSVVPDVGRANWTRLNNYKLCAIAGNVCSCPPAIGLPRGTHFILKEKMVNFLQKGHHFLKWCPKGTVSVPPFLSEIDSSSEWLDSTSYESLI